MHYNTRLAMLALVTLGLASCSHDSGDKDDSAPDNDASLDSNIPSAPENGDGSPAAGFFEKNDKGVCDLKVREETCVAESFESETIPLDIYLMIDRSGSMCNCVDPIIDGQKECPAPGCRKTRMDAIRDAVTAFMNDPASNGLGLGVGYFGQQPLGAADCNPETYGEPSVAIGTLPTNASPVAESLSTAEPTGETPTGSAIRGACSYAQAWKSKHSTHETVVLFLTDGEPKAPVSCPDGAGSCCPSLADATAAASECLDASPSIRTYVLGVGPFLGNLSQIAVAGGTKHAYLVEEGDVSSQVLSALNAIRGDAAMPCQFRVPENNAQGQLDYGRIGIAYADLDCNAEVFSRLAAASDCGDGNGWYLDRTTSATKVRLCPESCGRVSAVGGSLFYSVGCNWEDTIQ